MKYEFKPLYNDVVFNFIFSKKEYAISLINAIMGTNYDLESVRLYTTNDDNVKHNDIVVELDNEIYNLEAYDNFTNSNIEHSKQISAHIYGSQLDIADNNVSKDLIQINICKNVDIDLYLDRYGVYRVNGEVGILNDYFDILIFNLDKIKELQYNVGISDELYRILKLFNADSIEEMFDISKGDEKLMVMTASIEKFLNDPETQKLFDRDKWKAKEHEEIGEKRSLNTVAINMLKANKPIDEITTFTGLTEEAILKLKKSACTK